MKIKIAVSLACLSISAQANHTLSFFTDPGTESPGFIYDGLGFGGVITGDKTPLKQHITESFYRYAPNDNPFDFTSDLVFQFQEKNGRYTTLTIDSTLDTLSLDEDFASPTMTVTALPYTIVNVGVDRGDSTGFDLQLTLLPVSTPDAGAPLAFGLAGLAAFGVFAKARRHQSTISAS